MWEIGEKFMYLGYGNGAVAILGGNYESKKIFIMHMVNFLNRLF